MTGLWRLLSWVSWQRADARIKLFVFALTVSVALRLGAESAATTRRDAVPALTIYRAGDSVKSFQLVEWIDDLGLSKNYEARHYWKTSHLHQLAITRGGAQETADSNSSDGRDGKVGRRDYSDQSIVPAEEQRQCFGEYCLRDNIFHGGHGDVWRARRLGSDKDSQEDAFVLKRMRAGEHSSIRLCALREIYFGKVLQGQPMFPQFITYFVEKGDFWLVFRDEGTSLLNLMYAVDAQSGRNAILRTSRIWYKMRTTAAGMASLKGIMYQLIANVADLHQHGILHRDIKPSNILLSRDRLPRVILADFSSAVDLNHTSFDALMYDVNGPSVQESTLLYAPPEVLLSLTSQPSRADSPSSTSSASLSIPFSLERPFSYDIWSIGVVFLELILGSADVFSVDQRTAAMVAQKLQRQQIRSFRNSDEASFSELYRKALLMASLADYCIFQRALLETERPNEDEEEGMEDYEAEHAVGRKSQRQAEKEAWMQSSIRRHLHSRHSQAVSSLGCDIIARILPESPGEEYEDEVEQQGNGEEAANQAPSLSSEDSSRRANTRHARTESDAEDSVEREDCSQREFSQAILRRDPLGKGFHDPWGLDLLRRLLHFDPLQRISLSDSLQHAYFHGPYISLMDRSLHATAKERDEYDLLREQQEPELRASSEEEDDQEVDDLDGLLEEEVEEMREGIAFASGEQGQQPEEMEEVESEKRAGMGDGVDVDDPSKRHTLANLDENRLGALIASSRSLSVWTPSITDRRRTDRYPLTFFAGWTCPALLSNVDQASLPLPHPFPSSSEAVVQANRNIQQSASAGDEFSFSIADESDGAKVRVQDLDIQSAKAAPASAASPFAEPSTDPSSSSGEPRRRPGKSQQAEFVVNTMERARRSALESGIQELSFHCPHCRRSFHNDWHACQRHMRLRRHGPLCRYTLHESQQEDSLLLSRHPFLSSPLHLARAEYYQQASLSSRNAELLAQLLPPCLSQHSLLPVDEQVGWCDLQGRRAYVEDAHALLFAPGYVFTGVFDGHFGSLAAHFVATELHSMFVQNVLQPSSRSAVSPSDQTSDDAYYSGSDMEGKAAVIPTWFREINFNIPAEPWESVAAMVPPEQEELFSFRSCQAKWDQDRQRKDAGEEVDDEEANSIATTEWEEVVHERKSPCLSLYLCTNGAPSSGDGGQCSSDSVMTPRFLRHHLKQAFRLTNEILLRKASKTNDRSQHEQEQETASTENDGDARDPSDLPPRSLFTSSLPAPSAPSIGGSTATILFLLPDHILAVASVGDSRIVACCALSVHLAQSTSTASPNARIQDPPHWEFSMQPVQLSVDHTPHNANERKRVEDLGGRIEGEVLCTSPSCAEDAAAQESRTVLRVNGKLAVTRSLGDPALSSFLSSEPDVLILRLPRPSPEPSPDPGDGYSRASADVCAEYFLWNGASRPVSAFVPLFLVVGSDGLWDVMSNAQTVEMVCADLLAEVFSSEALPSKDAARRGLFQRISMHLAQEALLRGSSDNIGVSVIDVQDH